MAKRKSNPARKLLNQLCAAYRREQEAKAAQRAAKKVKNVMKRDMNALNEFFFGNGGKAKDWLSPVAKPELKK